MLSLMRLACCRQTTHVCRWRLSCCTCISRSLYSSPRSLWERQLRRRAMRACRGMCGGEVGSGVSRKSRVVASVGAIAATRTTTGFPARFGAGCLARATLWAATWRSVRCAPWQRCVSEWMVAATAARISATRPRRSLCRTASVWSATVRDAARPNVPAWLTAGLSPPSGSVHATALSERSVWSTRLRCRTYRTRITKATLTLADHWGGRRANCFRCHRGGCLVRTVKSVSQQDRVRTQFPGQQGGECHGHLQIH